MDVPLPISMGRMRIHQDQNQSHRKTEGKVRGARSSTRFLILLAFRRNGENDALLSRFQESLAFHIKRQLWRIPSPWLHRLETQNTLPQGRSKADRLSHSSASQSNITPDSENMRVGKNAYKDHPSPSSIIPALHLLPDRRSLAGHFRRLAACICSVYHNDKAKESAFNRTPIRTADDSYRRVGVFCCPTR